MAGKKQDDEPKKNPNTIGEAGQVAGNTRDRGFGGAYGGGTGNQSDGGRTPGEPIEGSEGGSAKGSLGADAATR